MDDDLARRLIEAANAWEQRFLATEAQLLVERANAETLDGICKRHEAEIARLRAALLEIARLWPDSSAAKTARAALRGPSRGG